MTQKRRDQTQRQGLEMRVAALEDKLAALQATEDLHKVRNVLGRVSAATVAPFEAAIPCITCVRCVDTCLPCGRCTCGHCGPVCSCHCLCSVAASDPVAEFSRFGF